MNNLPPHVYARTYKTKMGLTRRLYYIRFVDWQGVERKFPGGDNLSYTKELRTYLLGLNSGRHDFDEAQLAKKLSDIEFTRGHEIDPFTTAANKGTLYELQVSTNLLSRGWYVFRSIGANAPCDLVICKSARLYRVEVKGALRRKTGSIDYTRPRDGLYDILALAFPDGTIEYRPDLTSLENAQCERPAVSLSTYPVSVPASA